MHIQSLYIHPIKSLLPLAVPSSSINALGFPHDRTFLLQRTDTTPPKTCHISFIPSLCLFAQALSTDGTTLTITHTPSGETLAMPLTPDVTDLEQTEITMHQSPCAAHIMPSDPYSSFFSTHLSFPVRLLYLGAHTRSVLGNVSPASAPGSKIGFADCAPLLFASTASLADVSARLPTEFDGDIRRFRPNIVLAPDEGEELGAWEEDYWARVKLGDVVEVDLTANCARCTSLNVDFDNHKGGTVAPGMQPLKALMRDRRVDAGIKYSPIFGRYGFLDGSGGDGEVVRVGDRVVVAGKNEERTKFFWPGLSTGTRVAT